MQTNFTKVPNEIIWNESFDVYEKAVLSYLLSLNPCHPSYSKIAKRCNISESKAKEVIKVLRSKNVVSCKVGYGRRHNEYTVNTSTQWRLVANNNNPGSSKAVFKTSSSPQDGPLYNNIKNNKTNVEASTVVATTDLNSSNSESSKKDSELTNTTTIDSKDNTSRAVHCMDQEVRSLEIFKNHCKHFGPYFQDTQNYFFELIKSDINHQVGFNEIEALIAESTNSDAEALEGYRHLFRAAREEQVQVGSHELR